MSHWQRRHRRVPFAFPVVVRWKGNSLRGFCQRIATMGLYVYHHEPYPIDAEVELEFALPVVEQASLALRGRVRRSDGEDLVEGLLGGMQILFEDLGQEEQAILEMFVSSCIQREAEYSGMGPSLAELSLVPHFEVRYFGTGTSRSEYVEDISEGGVLIRTLRPVPKGSRVQLTLYLPGSQQVAVDGTVVWSRRHDPKEPGKAGIGIQFADIEPWAQQMIGSFVANFGEEVQIPWGLGDMVVP